VKALERLENLARCVCGHGAAISVDREKDAARPLVGNDGGSGYVARVWSASGKPVEWAASSTRAGAVQDLIRQLQAKNEVD